jgi:hypothetical protein
MTNSPTDERRAAFEKWIGNPHMLNKEDDPALKGAYSSPYTKGAWEAWQAALSHQGEVVKVSELQALCDDWRKNATSAFTLGCADHLTALISKAEKV